MSPNVTSFNQFINHQTAAKPANTTTSSLLSNASMHKQSLTNFSKLNMIPENGINESFGSINGSSFNFTLPSLSTFDFSNLKDSTNLSLLNQSNLNPLSTTSSSNSSNSPSTNHFINGKTSTSLINSKSNTRNNNHQFVNSASSHSSQNSNHNRTHANQNPLLSNSSYNNDSDDDVNWDSLL